MKDAVNFYTHRRLQRGGVPGRVKKNRYRYVDTESCADASRVFAKRKNNPTYTHRLMLNGERLAIGTAEGLRVYCARHRIAGTVEELSE